jgi:flagellar biosynthetic protein FlhB
MSEQRENGQERTEQPTPKRLREAREKGQVPRSRELTMTIVMLIGAAALLSFGGWFADRVQQLLTRAFRIGRSNLLDKDFMLRHFGDLAGETLLLLAPLMGALLVGAVLAPGLLGGWNFSRQAIAFKGDRLDPVRGLKRVFGSKGLMELLKALGKFAVVGAGAAVFLWSTADRFMSLSRLPIGTAIGESAFLAALALLVMSAVLILIAAIDVPFQLYSHNKEMRMTRQEVREEMKQTEGRPEVKSKIRSLQQELASRRMMEDVPSADVVVTNPTHFAVALRYDQDSMDAPVVVAKGVERIALTIRRIAEENGVPRLESPPLARALHASVEIGRPIPPELYVAVAEVLAWVHRVRHAPDGEPVPPPPAPGDLPV